MKRYLYFLVLLPLMTGCLTGYLIPDVKQEGWKAGGIYLLHNNPAAGDFAEYHITGRTVVGGTIELNYYWEGTKTVNISSINNGVIRIDERITTDKLVREGGSSLMSVSPSPPVYRTIKTDMEGKIIEVMVNGRKIQIAEKGENGYLEHKETGQTVAVDIETGTFTARPAYCQAKRGYSVKSCLVNQNNFWDEISIVYTADNAMFRTVIEQTMVIGTFDNTVATSKMAMIAVQGLTFTPFFTNPASLITGAGKGGLKDYIWKSALPGKQEAAKTIAKNIMDITTNSSLNNSGVAYLRKQGNMFGRR